ncbi:MAG TPA: OmpW family outer membrane protein [Chitinophagaceae bacterium]|nr:OmpW family outer membrane protein [Chitinophagaceae bacterium]
MKISLIALVFLFLTTSAFAQDDYAYTQGSSTISAGYGVGNIWKKLFKLSASFSGGTNKVSATGPFTLIYEYGFSDKISAGVAFGYSNVKSDYDDGAGDKYSESLRNISAIVRANYHFGSSEKLDPYVGLGIGYYNFKYGYDDNSGTPMENFAIPTALGYSAQLGAKYYFSSSIGVFAEVGYVAGSYGQVGITARF